MNENILSCIKAQKDLCESKGYPHFAPSSGGCWKCNRNIYQDYEVKHWNGSDDVIISKGYSSERASKELITGCPHCSRSYCD